MKIAIISDCHLGHNYGSELGDDAFDQFRESLEQVILKKVDIILLPGDIFDSRTPRQEVFARAMKLLQIPLLAEKNHTSLTDIIGTEKDVSPITFSGIPVIAIHGTHERRGVNSVNPIELLEQGGYKKCLIVSGSLLKKPKS